MAACAAAAAHGSRPGTAARSGRPTPTSRPRPTQYGGSPPKAPDRSNGRGSRPSVRPPRRSARSGNRPSPWGRRSGRLSPGSPVPRQPGKAYRPRRPAVSGRWPAGQQGETGRGPNHGEEDDHRRHQGPAGGPAAARAALSCVRGGASTRIFARGPARASGRSPRRAAPHTKAIRVPTTPTCECSSSPSIRSPAGATPLQPSGDAGCGRSARRSWQGKQAGARP